MKRRLLTVLLAAGVMLVGAATALSIPATTQMQTVWVRLPSGEVIPVAVDVPPGASLDDIELPGTPVSPPTTPEPPGTPSTPTTPTVPTTPTTTPTTPTIPVEPPPPPTPTTPEPAPAPAPAPGPQPRGRLATSGRKKAREVSGGVEVPAAVYKRTRDRGSDGRTKLRNADGTPTPSNPGFIDALPGPSTATGRPELHHPQVPGPALPAADLPGRGNRVRHPLGDPGGDQRDRDGLRPQPERLERRGGGLDAVHALDLGAVRRLTPTRTAARIRTTRSTRSSPRPAT